MTEEKTKAPGFVNDAFGDFRRARERIKVLCETCGTDAVDSPAIGDVCREVLEGTLSQLDNGLEIMRETYSDLT